ncbi:helix-turn-helix domain-containing protein [Nocardioides sp. B-3]|uniref:helix-turn-helix domain-containing protein n=1 Tax=Nocardioides sp. B-3 TaxID=2895565 RepID=UPI002153A46D|nr:helix-turn-helix domain-containing protein [Nocardioides sp. B-3]UUZ61364.1 helix-turn-helix domain-containing protein [Nocardioides sp. B-3]
MSHVPAATRTLRVLRFPASQPDPVALDRISRACDLPRSTAYHLVNAMIAEGFVVHLEDERRYGPGVAAFEVGTGFARPGTPATHRAPTPRRPGSTRRGTADTGRAPRARRPLRDRGARAGSSAAGD